MSLSTTFYNTFAKRNSVYVTSIFTAAFVFGIGFDTAITSFWDRWNAGRQWKDIRHRYIQQEEE
ncbi:ubiquinol-cytochrome C reductase UQCRX/QCR9-like protein [Marasmius fiardii PR-910]|nr:ubiquinol-cytochrome C reductase UQCRX/QCR9-like protein [Marasmius fiardii PR-910]